MTYTFPPATRCGERETNRTPGVCRVCGCTDAEACLVDPEGDIAHGVMPMTCHWVDADLCSRCHRPGRPTRRQAYEIARLRAYKGRLRVLPGPRDGDLRVQLLAQGFEGAVTRQGLLRAKAPPSVVLNAAGRVVGR